MGQDNTQNNTFGYDPQQLTQFAQGSGRRAVSGRARGGPSHGRRRRGGSAGGARIAAPESGRVRQLAERVLQSARANLPALGWTGVAQLVSANLGIPLF